MATSHETLDASLRILTELYGSAVSDYVRKVARAESHASDLEPGDVISIAYIVLDRVKVLYNSDIGEFQNYAIRALKHEFLRAKQKGYSLYLDSDGEDALQTLVQTSDNLYANEESAAGNTEVTLELQHRETLYLAMAASLLESLTPLEKVTIYFSYFVSYSMKTVSFKTLSEKSGVPKSTLTNYHLSATRKLREHLSKSTGFDYTI